METVQSIGEAIKLIDTKKEGLKKAYDDLQANSPSVFPSFSLTWSDLDSHFTSLQNSLIQRFRLLESLESGHQPHQEVGGIAGTSSLVDSATTCPDSDPSAVSVHVEATAELGSGNDPPESSRPPSPGRIDSVPAPLDSNSSPNAEAQAESPSSAHQEQNLASATESLASPVPLDKARGDAGATPPTPDPSALPQSSEAPEAGAAIESRPELKAFCSNVDGKGLIKYVIDHGNERSMIRAQLTVEIHNCPDPGNLILDAMGGFYQTKRATEDEALPKPKRIKTMRSGCVFLLEVLIGASPQLSDRAKRRAKGLALMWKKRAKINPTQAQVFPFLLLVAAFGIGTEFSFEELAEFFSVVASTPRAPELCRGLGLGDGIPDLIQKLVSDRKELLAVRLIFDLGMSDKFPPVPILKTHLNEMKKLTEDASTVEKNSPQSQREVIDKEIEVLESVIKLVVDHKLEAEYPKEELHRRVQQLNRLRAEKRRPAKPQNLQLSGNKRPRAAPADAPRRAAGFAPHLGPGSGYVLPASAGASSSYPVPAAGGLYVSAGGAPPRPYLYPSELQRPPLYGNTPLPPAYGGYGAPPQYGLPYYPH